MMHGTFDAGLPFFGALHALSMMLFSIGLLFLIVWAVKTLSHAQLKKWGIKMIVIGIIGCILTLGGMRLRWNDGEMKRGMPGEMMKMSMMLKNKTGDDFDKAFIEGMIPHHQGAIEMAKVAKTSAKHAEIKKMADAIIAAQQKEIDTMKAWQKAWGYTE